jgi:3-hydroxymyristoyl/3-hydroxydecanoyl-(acyl carrier protein) dehydratase
MTGNEGKLAYFGGMDRVRFRRPVLPGDTLVTKVEMIGQRGNIGKVRAVASVAEQVVAEAEFIFALVDQESPEERETAGAAAGTY